MTVRNLEALFKPASIALLGASSQPGSLGNIILKGLAASFDGPVFPVNPRFASGPSHVHGMQGYPDIAALPAAPDLAVIVTPWHTVPGIVRELGKIGTRGCCIITAGPQQQDERAKSWHQDILDAAKPHLMRVVGPNGVGLQVPGGGVNASFAHLFPRAGSIGFVAQSGAVITAVLDWANPRGIGFSHVVSLGDMVDVDFGDMLDYLATDPCTDSILLYIEAVTSVRKFISSARAAARVKPVIVVKAGRQEAGARAAASHTGALAGNDAVYDAVFRRAGMLRVHTLAELFSTIEALATTRIPAADSLTILTNGGGMGVLAADELMAHGGQLTRMEADTLAALSAVLPANWSHGNPIDIIGDATGSRYTDTLDILLAAPETNAVLILNCPTAITSSEQIAATIIDQMPAATRISTFTCWVGEESVRGARAKFAAAGIATYESPEEAVRTFARMIAYRRNQEQLMQTPPSLPVRFEPDTTAARAVITRAQSERREWLNEFEAKCVLAAYGIPVVETFFAASSAEVGAHAATIAGPVAIKIVSADVTHKSDVGGVLLNVDPSQAAAAAEEMQRQVGRRLPDAHLQGFTVQQMVSLAGTFELIAGIALDAQFGPVILFGHGGTAVEVIDDKSLALVPLNMKLAHELISRTRVYEVLKGYRHVKPAQLDDIALTLVKLAQLACDIAAIDELDINPLLAHANGVVALDARIRVNLQPGSEDRLAIRPYPKELEQVVTIVDRGMLLRPVIPEDERALRAAFDTADASNLNTLDPHLFESHRTIARLTQIDYDRQMVLMLTEQAGPGKAAIVAFIRLVEDPDRTHGEVSLATFFAGDDAAEIDQAVHVLLQCMFDYALQREIGRLTFTRQNADTRNRLTEYMVGLDGRYALHARDSLNSTAIEMTLQPHLRG